MALLGSIMTDRNDDVTALPLFEQSLGLFRQLGDVWGTSRVNRYLGRLYLNQGEYEKARWFINQHLESSAALSYLGGTVNAFTVNAFIDLGDLYRYQGDYDRAEESFERAMAICRERDLKGMMASLFFSLGMLALQRNHYSRAARHFSDYFDFIRRVNEQTGVAVLFTGLAAVAAGTEHPERAAQLHGAARPFLATGGDFLPFERAEFDRHMQIARAEIGEARFEALAADGRAMTMEQAIAYALKH
jgi:uncharacterized protein HemY